MPSFRQGISELPYLCLQHGIEHAVISPGSRNAPLIISFAKNSDMQCISIIDERSAAYYALGMAIFLQKPVALICTSGTAALNYGPAIAEAYYLQIPLLVLTADRPAEWIDQNDGQTIHQNFLYGHHVKKSYTLPVDTSAKEDLWLWRRIVSEAINETTLASSGPVHINIPLREPLYAPLPQVEKSIKVQTVLSGTRDLSDEQWKELSMQWQQSPKRLIICGLDFRPDHRLAKVLEQLVIAGEAVVIAENLSNLVSPYFIDTPETFFASIDANSSPDFKPDLLITLAGSVLSKRMKNFLRRNKPHQHWHVGTSRYFVDTFECLSMNIDTDPWNFFHKMTLQYGDKDYVQQALSRHQKNRASLEDYLNNIAFSDFLAYQYILQQIPEGYALHLANSTVVRYAQLFGSRADIRYFSNRGTSGIDGCVSTAAGYALISKQPTLLIAGDLAFIYDSNGLWNNTIPETLRIIVIENQGGNIFKLIETSEEIEGITDFFETPHQVQIDKLCSAYGIKYLQASGADELSAVLHEFFKPNQGPVVLSIKTSGTLSANIFKQYFHIISKHP